MKLIWQNVRYGFRMLPESWFKLRGCSVSVFGGQCECFLANSPTWTQAIRIVHL
jgi:hypothetical protein